MSSSAPASNLKRKRDGDEDFAISTIRHRDDLLARAEAKVAPHELANDASILVVGPSGAARSRISSALSACSGRHRKLDLSVRTCEKLPLEIDFTSRLERQKKSKRVDADQQREWEEARSRLGADLVVFVLDVTSSRAFDALRESVGCISPEFWELRCFVLKVNGTCCVCVCVFVLAPLLHSAAHALSLSQPATPPPGRSRLQRWTTLSRSTACSTASRCNSVTTRTWSEWQIA